MKVMQFNNKTNRNFFNLFVHDSGERQFANQRINFHQIEGRDGELVETTEVYDSYERNVVLFSKTKEKYQLGSWLRGSGKLSFSDEDGGYYKATVKEINTKKSSVKKGWWYEVTFHIQPFFWLKSGELYQKFTENTLIHNIYGIPTKPLIKLIGNGTVKISINDQEMKVNNVTKEVYIDVDKMICYDKDGLNKGKDMIGEYVQIGTEDNMIKLTNCIAEIQMRWCER